MSDRDEFGAFLAGFVIGGLTGAFVSLLLAPQSGEQTRTMLRDKAIELSDLASHNAEEAYEQAERAVSIARTRLDELAAITKERAEELQSRGQVVLEEQKAKITGAIQSKRKPTTLKSSESSD